MPCPSQSSRFNHPGYIRWTVQLWSSSLWSLLHSPFSSLLGPNIRLRILFSNTLSLDSSLNVRDHVSQYNIIVHKNVLSISSCIDHLIFSHLVDCSKVLQIFSISTFILPVMLILVVLVVANQCWRHFKFFKTSSLFCDPTLCDLMLLAWSLFLSA